MLRVQPIADRPRVLTWSEVEAGARLAFHIWRGQPELGWARMAWDHLVSAGLTIFESEAERCRAALRFMTLAAVYHRWCRVVHEESSCDLEDLPLEEWSDALGVSRDSVARLVSELGISPDEADAETVALALRCGIEDEWDSVVSAIRSGFGGEASLFVSLWRSSRSSEDEGETDDSILNELSTPKLIGYEWTTAGCPR